MAHDFAQIGATAERSERNHGENEAAVMVAIFGSRIFETVGESLARQVRTTLRLQHKEAKRVGL